MLAACVWLPPAAGAEPPHERLGGLLARELSTAPPDLPELPGAFHQACPQEPHWKVFLVCAPDLAGAWDRELAGSLLSPGPDAVDEEGAPAVAIVFRADHLPALSPLGFGGAHEVPLAPGADVWLVTRRSLHPRRNRPGDR